MLSHNTRDTDENYPYYPLHNNKTQSQNEWQTLSYYASPSGRDIQLVSGLVRDLLVCQYVEFYALLG